MKILSYNSGENETKQIVVMIMTMHVIDTKSEGNATYKKFPAAISKEWKILDEKEYTIQYPKSWQLDKSGNGGAKFVLFSQASPLADQFRNNVNLLVQDLRGQNMNLDKFVEMSEQQVKTKVCNGKILEAERSCNAGYELHKVVFTGESGPYKLKFVQYYWVKNEKAYILTLTCDIEEFDKHKKTAAKIMNSFKFQ